MPNVVILQRVVPPYRMPLYERLWKEFGWTVAYGSNLAAEGMRMEHEASFLRGYDFDRWPLNFTRVPVSKIIDDLKPDAVIAEGALRMTSTWELIARRQLHGQPKLFFWSIGYNPSKAENPAAAGSGQWIYPFIYRHADGCLTYGNDGRDFLQPRLSGKPVFVARNAVDMEHIHSARAEASALPRRGFPELISMSRLTPAKEYVKLVKAFQIILRALPDAQLTIIGDGPDVEAVKSAAGADLGRQIHLLGAMYNEREVAPHMQRADAFMLTGRVGLAINHALGYGLPIFCFKRGVDGPLHGSEIAHLQDGLTGYQVEGSSAEDFAGKVVSLFQQKPDLKSRHKNLIENYVAQQMSIDFMIQGFREINALLSKSHGNFEVAAAR
jgi:glycosyltransferase involved in cell wall biosynthesis